MSSFVVGGRVLRRLLIRGRHRMSTSNCRPSQVALALHRAGGSSDRCRRLLTSCISQGRGKCRCNVNAEGKSDIGGEVSFVDLIKNEDARSRQLRVVLESAGEDAFGDHFDSSIFGDHRAREFDIQRVRREQCPKVRPYAEQLLERPLDALENDDATAAVTVVEEVKRNQRRFTRLAGLKSRSAVTWRGFLECRRGCSNGKVRKRRTSIDLEGSQGG